jgi:quinol monooxygenase YgiN
VEVTVIIVHVHINVKPEFIEDFKQVTLENARNSIQEPGIARFDVIQNTENPSHFLLLEVYRTVDASGKHKDTRHYQVWRETVQKMMAEPRRSEKYTNIFPDDKSWDK